MTATDLAHIARINALDLTPVIFVHGLWLLQSSWDRWAALFEEAGYAPLAPGWPDDPGTVAEAHAHREVIAGKSVGQVADHVADLIGRLDRKPVVVGHSFGGLLTQMLAGRGLSGASVAIDPAPFRGVLPLPVSSLRSARAVLGNPANFHRAVPLTYDRFRYSCAHAVSEEEARAWYEEFAVPAPGEPLFQAAVANFNPGTEVKVDTLTPGRGPLLILSGEKDNTVPWALAHASYKRQGPQRARGQRDHRNGGPWPRLDRRPRLARGRRNRPGLRQTLHGRPCGLTTVPGRGPRTAGG